MNTNLSGRKRAALLACLLALAPAARAQYMFYNSDASRIETSNTSLYSGTGLLGSNGGLSVGYNGIASPAGGAIFSSNVGIGTGTPVGLLTIGNNLFQVNASGNIVKINNISYSWPASQGGVNTFLRNDGSGNLIWSGATGDNLGNHIATQTVQLNGNYLNNDGGATEGLAVDNSGNIVVRSGQLDATALPPALDVHGAWLRIGDGQAAAVMPNGVGIKFNDTGTAHATQRYDPATQKMRFGKSNTTSVAAFDAEPALTLDLANSRVGISTSAPQAALDVAGDALVNSVRVGQGPNPNGTAANGNVVLGNGAGAALAAGSYRNYLIGYNAGGNITTGGDNVIIGNAAAATTRANTLIAGTNANGGDNSVVLGNLAGQSASASGQVLVGYAAGRLATGGANSVAVGALALQNNTGAQNVAVGYSAGSAITTGANNVIIGGHTGAGIATASNNIIIADGSGNNRIQVDANGLVGVSIAAPAARLDVKSAGSTSSDYAQIWRDSGGSVVSSISATGMFTLNGGAQLAITGGNVGIGTTSPGAKFTIGSNQFQVSSTGDLVKINNVAYAWPGSQASGASVLRNDGSGNLSWAVLSSDNLGNHTATMNLNMAGYNITGAGYLDGSLYRRDLRTIAPSDETAGTLRFGFTSWANNNSAPYADFLHLRSYTDGTGGSDNLVMFSKSGIGMRIWQQSWGSVTPYASYKDIAFTDASNASGTWPNADTVDNLHATDFLRKVAAIDGNTAPDTLVAGQYWSPISANYPTASGHVITLKGGTGNSVTQLAQAWPASDGGDSGLWVRGRRDIGANIWGAWSKVWTDRNDGSGSTLDADLLDGLHKTTFGANIDVSGNNIRLLNSDGTQLASITAPYAASAGNADTVDLLHKTSFGASIDTSGNNIRLLNSDGTQLSSITPPYATTAGSASNADTVDSLHAASFLRKDTSDTLSANVTVNGYIARGAHAAGYLVGSYNNIGSNDGKSNPIYTIGSAYLPTDAALVNMYGIGYSHSNFWGAGKSTGWGLYTAAAGTVNNTLSESGIWSGGAITSAGAMTAGGNMTAAAYYFPAPAGDPSPYITARVVPAGQGAANEKTEMILFHSNDPANGSGVDQITLRAPGLSFQTYNNATVASIADNNGYNERMYIDPDGKVGIGMNSAGQKLEVAGNILATGGTIYNGNTTRRWVTDGAWNYFYTDYGSIRLGPANGSWAHIYADLPFYFNQELYVNNVQVVKNSGTWGIGITGNAATATKLNSQGNYANGDPGNTRGPSGLNLFQVYANGYPTTYGNVLHMNGAGGGQLLIGWSGTDGAHANNYVRSKRDNDSGAWSPWALLLTDQNYNSYAPTLTGGGASGTWGINITGSAGSASNADTVDSLHATAFLRAGTQSPAGNAEVAQSANSSSYSDASIELRELNYAGAQTGAIGEAPRISFHWGGRVASQIAMPTDGSIQVRNNPGTGYETFKAGNIYSNDNLVAYAGGSNASGTWPINISGSADMVDGLHAASFFQYPGWVTSPGYDANTIAGNRSGFTYSNNAPWTGPMAHFDAGGYGLQLNGTYSGGGNHMSFRTRNGDAGSWNGWYELIHSGNIGSQSVNYANSAGSASNSDTVDGHHFNWSGQGGQPSWVWGGNDSTNMYVWNPSNFNVATANKVNGYGSSPDGSHPGTGLRPFYSWNTGCAYNGSGACYSNGISVGSHPSDQAYGFQIVQNMWDDNLYFRRYNGGWQNWKTVLMKSFYYRGCIGGNGLGGTCNPAACASGDSDLGNTCLGAGNDNIYCEKLCCHGMD